MKLLKLIFILLIIIYLILLLICIRYYSYIKDKEMILFWILSFLGNTIIILISKRIKKKKLFIFFGILFVNSIVLTTYLYLPGNIYYLSQLTKIDRFKDYLFNIILVFATGNWLLPIIFYLGINIYKKSLVLCQMWKME